MKCINNYGWKLGIWACLLGICILSGCGEKSYDLDQPYDAYEAVNDLSFDVGAADASGISFFADDLCVGEDEDTGLSELSVPLSESVGIFCMTDGTIPCAKNIYKKLYPASTTKILTAYLALKYGNLEDTITVSEKAANPSSDSSVCGIRQGDQLTLEQLLYGLLLKSGNDAAIAIAEYISGDVDAFAQKMNQEAARIGATHSHFVNPHGLHDDAHYTCAYDLYLLFQEALKLEEFKKIIATPSYQASYVDKDGNPVTQDWESTDQYLNGKAAVPDGVTVIGGKTGTTMAAGNCLVLYSKNRQEQDVVSIVLKANGREQLYQLMTELLGFR